ncbi:integrase core domain protein [archaeon]|nr:integrase core domain protein [archaeon]
MLEEGIKKYGLPDAILTDRGSQFYANDGERKTRGECEFERYFRVNGIKHIIGRVNHPQTNGKVERFYGAVAQKLSLFNSTDELETPAKAFFRKLPPERIIYYS